MTSINLVSKFGPVEQQGRPNTCVAHAVTSALEATFGLTDLSRLFVYWNARSYAGQTSFDAGCQTRNAVRGIANFGAPQESFFPYDVSQITVRPPAEAYSAATSIRSRIRAYQSVTSLTAMKAALTQGLPVSFSFMVPDTFVSDTKFSGVQPMFTSTTRWLGAHAVVAVGFDDVAGTVLCRNSFGPTWGSAGYFTMSYAWFATFGSRVFDAWVFVPA